MTTYKTVQKKITELEKLAMAGESGAVRSGIRGIVPEYTPTDNGHVLNYEAAKAQPAAATPNAGTPGEVRVAEDVRVAVAGGGPVRRTGW